MSYNADELSNNRYALFTISLDPPRWKYGEAKSWGKGREGSRYFVSPSPTSV